MIRSCDGWRSQAAGSLGSSLRESDEQPTQNEDKAPVSFDGRQTKLVLKLVSQNNIQTNTQINAKCLNCQENSAHLSHLRGTGGHRVWQLPESPKPWGRKPSLGTDSPIQCLLLSMEPCVACSGKWGGILALAMHQGWMGTAELLSL